MQIREEAGIAQPSSQAQARFTATTIGVRDVTFENLQHDFPQRVIYRRTADGGLHARIEGVQNGQRRGVDFPYGPCRAARRDPA